MFMGVNSLAPLQARPTVHPNVIKLDRLTSFNVGVVDSEPGNLSLHSVAWRIYLVLAVFVWTTWQPWLHNAVIKVSMVKNTIACSAVTNVGDNTD